jgi:hypothetical protein
MRHLRAYAAHQLVQAVARASSSTVAVAIAAHTALTSRWARGLKAAGHWSKAASVVGHSERQRGLESWRDNTSLGNCSPSGLVCCLAPSGKGLLQPLDGTGGGYICQGVLDSNDMEQCGRCRPGNVLAYGQFAEQAKGDWGRTLGRHPGRPRDGQRVIAADGGLGSLHFCRSQGGLQDCFLQDNPYHLQVGVGEVPVGVGC